MHNNDPKPHRRADGFTLIEALIAFTIFALSFAAILQIFGSGLGNRATADHALIALAHAESLMARAGIEQPMAVGTRSGRFEDGMTWREQITLHQIDAAVTDSTLPAGMTPYEVTIAVTWRDGRKTREITLNSLRLGASP